MFLNHFLTSIEQGSWIKSCVLQGIVLWTSKTTSEKHERARSLHRRRHHVYHCLSIGYVCDTAVEELHFCVGCPQVLRKQVRRCQCQAWRSQPCNSTLTTAVTVPVCCRGLRHAKCQEIGHLYNKLMDDHNIFKQYVQDLVYGGNPQKTKPLIRSMLSCRFSLKPGYWDTGWLRRIDIMDWWVPGRLLWVRLAGI